MPLSGHHDVALFWITSTLTLNRHIKLDNDFIIVSLKSKTTGKLINSIPGSRLFISSLPGEALKPCLANLISKDSHLVFSIYWPIATQLLSRDPVWCKRKCTCLLMQRGAIIPTVINVNHFYLFLVVVIFYINTIKQNIHCSKYLKEHLMIFHRW